MSTEELKSETLVSKARRKGLSLSMGSRGFLELYQMILKIDDLQKRLNFTERLNKSVGDKPIDWVALHKLDREVYEYVCLKVSQQEQFIDDLWCYGCDNSTVCCTCSPVQIA